MATENAAVDTVEPAPATQEEKIEPTTNGEHKTENGNGEAPANGEAPNAESTPIKSKTKRRAIVANMRAAFGRLGLMSQLRALGRRMRRTPKQKAQEVAPTEEKAAENGNGAVVDPAASATVAEEKPAEEKCNGHTTQDNCNGNTSAGEEAQCQSSVTVVEPANTNETTEQPAVVAQ